MNPGSLSANFARSISFFCCFHKTGNLLAEDSQSLHTYSGPLHWPVTLTITKLITHLPDGLGFFKPCWACLESPSSSCAQSTFKPSAGLPPSLHTHCWTPSCRQAAALLVAGDRARRLRIEMSSCQGNAKNSLFSEKRYLP